jgi:hypothetical protein
VEELVEFSNRKASVSDGERHLKDEEGMDWKEVGGKKPMPDEDKKAEKTTH